MVMFGFYTVLPPSIHPLQPPPLDFLLCSPHSYYSNSMSTPNNESNMGCDELLH